MGLSKTPANKAARVFYGFPFIPSAEELLHGGLVKFQKMQELYPNAPTCFNILYMVSSAQPRVADKLAALAKSRGRILVWNQNGVAYPGWHGTGWETKNESMMRILHMSDHVFYQSEFCLKSADQFLGERQGSKEVLYNAVDTEIFTPAVSPPPSGRLILLLGGNQYQRYRLETALRTLAAVRRRHRDTAMIVTGRLSWARDEKVREDTEGLLREMDLKDAVEFVGPYSQHDAPDIYRRAHLLLHTKYNDPCPGLVVEAMACGLPVVYSSSGGVPELVGDAGIGVDSRLSYDHDIPPDPEELSEAVLGIFDNRNDYSKLARARAVERFDIRPWLNRHQEVFGTLLNQ